MYVPIVEIYMEAACSLLHVGAFGVVLHHHSVTKTKRIKTRFLSGVEQNTSQAFMELMAATKALERLDEPSTVNIYHRSLYLKKYISSGRPSEYAGLWAELDQASALHSVSLEFIKSLNRFSAEAAEMAETLVKRDKYRCREGAKISLGM